MVHRRRAVRVWLCVLTWLVVSSTPAGAQVGAGAFTGDVSDQAGRAVPGATVTVTSVGTNLSRISVTGPDGRYSVPGLLPGSYQVVVETSGFRPLTREGLRLATGETVRLDLQLEVGGLTEAITVTADAPLLRSETSGLGQVVDNRKVVDLPLNGRSFITLASLAPGVALPPGSSLPRINGGRPRTNEYLFDGISVLQPEPGQVAFFPNIDAIQEFKIESNSPPAEFGRFNGGVVNLTTKAGSNAVRGTALRVPAKRGPECQELLRHLESRQAPVPPQSIRRRDRRADSAEPDVLLRRLSRAATDDWTHGHLNRPHAVAASRRVHRSDRRPRAGHLRSGHDGFWHHRRTQRAAGFPAIRFPIGRMDPVALELLQRYPLPTGAGTANNYRRVDNETVDQDQFSVRIDHSVRNEQGSGVRTLDPVPGRVHSGRRPCQRAAASPRERSAPKIRPPRHLPPATSGRSRIAS